MMNRNINDKVAAGRSLWKELHLRAYKHDGSDDHLFIAQFSKKIPRYMKGCSCNEFWTKWKKDHPPVFTRKCYFEWTVRVHNAVNEKLGKPTICLQEAYNIWEPQAK